MFSIFDRTRSLADTECPPLFTVFNRRAKHRACTSRLLALPEEAICECLSYLDGQDLIHCIHCCTKLRSVTLGCAALELVIERTVYHRPAASDARDCSSVAHLARLRQREQAWLRLAPEHVTKFSYYYPPQSDHLGGGNILATLRSIDSPHRHAELDLMAVPHRLDGSRRSEICLKLSDYDFRRIVAFKVDEAQDLLVALVHVGSAGFHWTEDNDFELHILSTIDGKNHRLAENPRIAIGRLGRYTLPWNFEDGPHGDYIIHIRGPLILIYGRDVDLMCEGNMLYVFNWQTGSSSKLEVELGEHHVFDALFVADKGPMILLVIDQGFQLISIDDVSLGSETPLRQHALFCLPETKDGYHYAHSIFASRPVMGSAGDGIIVVLVKLVNFETAGPIAASFDLVIRIPPLIRLALEHNDPTATKELPWSDWGPLCARFFDVHICDSVLLSVSGYRVARSIPVYTAGNSLQAATCVHVYDFNQMTVRRDLGTGEGHDGDDSSDASSKSRLTLRSLFHPKSDSDESSEEEEQSTSEDEDGDGDEENTMPRPLSYGRSNTMPRLLSYRRSSRFPAIGTVTTRIETSPFFRSPEDSPFNEMVCCPMPYRVVSRTYKEAFTWVHLEPDTLITKARPVFSDEIHVRMYSM